MKANFLKAWMAAAIMACAVETVRATAQYDVSGTTLTVTVPTAAEEATFDETYRSLLTGNTVTDFVKEGPGILVMDKDILAYTGDIHVNGGIYRYILADANKQVLGVGALSDTAGAVTIASGATLEAATSVNCGLKTKRVVVG